MRDFRKAGIRVKGDERILGDSDFVENVLKTAGEALEEKYDLKPGAMISIERFPGSPKCWDLLPIG